MYFFSCPFFRNEVGGEEERVVSLTRSYSPSQSKHSKGPCHRPPLSCGVSILEYPIGETGWNDGTCPYRRNTKTIENVDEGALYFRNYFYKQGNLDTSSHYHIFHCRGGSKTSFWKEKFENFSNCWPFFPLVRPKIR